jgi:hypothetical protein
VADEQKSLEQERARMLDWLAHPEDHFPPYMFELGIADAIGEEVLILLELKETQCEKRKQNQQ